MKSLNYFTSTFNLIMSSLVGSIFGMLNSLLVNFTLLEISTSHIFSYYLGTAIILAGASLTMFLLFSKDSSNKHHFILEIKNEKLNKAKKTYFYCYSITLLLAGITILCLDREFYTFMSYFYKLPVYSLISIMFNISFCIVIIKLTNGIQNLLGNTENETKIIHSYYQYCIIFSASIILGTIFAIIFSSIEFETLSNNYLLKLQFLKEQNYCVPIGLGIGCLTGYLNEYIRSEINNCDFHPIDNTGDEDV